MTRMSQERMNTEALQGTWTKLPSNKWGIRSKDRLAEGDPVEVENKTRGRVDLVYVARSWKQGEYWYAELEDIK